MILTHACGIVGILICLFLSYQLTTNRDMKSEKLRAMKYRFSYRHEYQTQRYYGFYIWDLGINIETIGTEPELYEKRPEVSLGLGEIRITQEGSDAGYGPREEVYLDKSVVDQIIQKDKEIQELKSQMTTLLKNLDPK